MKFRDPGDQKVTNSGVAAAAAAVAGNYFQLFPAPLDLRNTIQSFAV